MFRRGCVGSKRVSSLITSDGLKHRYISSFHLGRSTSSNYNNLLHPRDVIFRSSSHTLNHGKLQSSTKWYSASPDSSTADNDDIILTKAGAERLGALQKQKENSKLALRLSVDSGGCSGFQYNFSVTDDYPKDDDIVFNQHGQKVVIDQVSMDFVKGSTIDFTEDLIRRSFEVVDNPNADSGCGCGASFAAKVDDF